MSDSQPTGFERYWDMPFGGNSPEKHIPKGFATFAVGFVRLVLSGPFRYKVKGAEKLFELSEKTGALVIANHTSFLDVLFIYLAVRPPIWPRFVARDTLFHNRILGWILARVGAYPITRDSADRMAVKRAVKFLKDGEVVCIMPEGARRGKSATEPQLHAGVALMARMAKVPIVPMTVRNAEKIKEKGKFLKFPQVSSEFGDPVVFSDFDFLPKDKRLEGCSWYAMRECFALSRRCAPEEVDMRELFPDAEDYTEVFAEHPIPQRSPAEAAKLFE